MTLREQATSGLLWTFSQQFGNQIIGFLVSLVLARILLPHEFGLIGMISVFISVGSGLLNAGLTQSLIRSEKLTQEDYSTVFFFNLIASIIIYIGIYFFAPLIADFYQQEILINIVRLYCLTFIIGAFSAVQLARLTKNMDFKTQTLVSIPANILAGAIGIIMAVSGYGVWSLVWSQLAQYFFGALQLWIYSKWTPSLYFSWNRFSYHFNFGYKLTLSSLLDKIFMNIYLIVIGKYFSVSQVGYYSRAETMKNLPVTNISIALNKVTFPLFASIQDDTERLKSVYKQLMQGVVFIVSPVLVILAVMAEPVFRFLFTEKWLPAVPYFQILCITGILSPIHAYNLNVLKIKGRSDLFLKLEIIKKIIIVLTIVSTIKFGILALLYGQVMISFISFFINSHYTGKFIRYGSFQQIKDIFPIVFLAVFVGFLIYLLDIFFFNGLFDILRIGINCFLGFSFYLLSAYILKMSILFNLKNFILKSNFLKIKKSKLK